MGRRCSLYGSDRNQWPDSLQDAGRDGCTRYTPSHLEKRPRRFLHRAARLLEQHVLRDPGDPRSTKVTSETITGDARKESRRPNLIPRRDILLADDFGT